MRFLQGKPAHDLTYSDVFLAPSRSAVSSRFDVRLDPCDATPTTIPIVSANMNSVTGPRLAAALARRGGLGILPQDMPLQALDEALHWVKAQPVGFDSAIELRPDRTVRDALGIVPAEPGYGITIVDAEGTHLGTVAAETLRDAILEAPLGDFLAPALPSVDLDEVRDARAAFDLMVAAELEFAPVVHNGQVVGTLSRRGALRSTIYRPALDAAGRLAVGAAIGINGDVAAKARAIVEAGADVLVVDTAHGHQEGTLRAVAAVAAEGLGVPIVAGNVVTRQGVRDIVGAGATIVKVGVGPGAMCTTRMMTAVGRPQFSAVLDTAEAARELGAHVWADGGVRYPRDVALALAGGAHAVMIGSWFAGTIEAPGAIARDASGRPYKESWGMASARAVTERFRRMDPYELARKQLFAEGISTSTIYLDPQRPSVEDLLDLIVSGVRSAMTYSGARDLDEFHERAVVGTQSAAGYEEGKALPVSW